MEHLQNSTVQLQLFLRLSFLLITKKNQKNYFNILRFKEVNLLLNSVCQVVILH